MYILYIIICVYVCCIHMYVCMYVYLYGIVKTLVVKKLGNKDWTKFGRKNFGEFNLSCF